MISERFDKIDKKQDKMIDKLHKMDVKFTKKVARNTVVCNAVIWFSCSVGIIIIGYLFTLIR